MQIKLALKKRDAVLDLELTAGFRWILGAAGVAFLAFTVSVNPDGVRLRE